MSINGPNHIFQAVHRKKKISFYFVQRLVRYEKSLLNMKLFGRTAWFTNGLPYRCG